MFQVTKVIQVGCLFAAAASALGAPMTEVERVGSGRQAKQEGYGVVTNQTVTVAGQDFFQHFVAAWRDRDLSERFSISIHERPSARWGSQIWVEYAQRRIFQASLPAARASIKALSEQAVDATYQQVTDADVGRLLFREADIGRDEI